MPIPCCPAAAPAAKERALADQHEALLQARTEADRKLDALNSRVRGVAERERELDTRHQQLTQQVEQAQAELERRQAAAEGRLEELAARERSLKRQEDGLEGLKVGGAASCAANAVVAWPLLLLVLGHCCCHSCRANGACSLAGGLRASGRARAAGPQGRG